VGGDRTRTERAGEPGGGVAGEPGGGVAGEPGGGVAGEPGGGVAGEPGGGVAGVAVAGEPSVPTGGPAPETASTRDRILDIALELFTEKGFDATSLQEIADQLGFTKAALYYHYRSKEDILMALHMRMHEFGRQSLDQLAARPVTLEAWESLLTSLLDEMLAQRPLFLMHERNQTVLERLHRKDHDAQHEDLQARLRQILSEPTIPLRDRVRMSCSLGAAFSVLFVGADVLDADPSKLAPLLRDALHDLLCPEP
jgi:AcrR family transcriptional regulator